MYKKLILTAFVRVLYRIAIMDNNFNEYNREPRTRKKDEKSKNIMTKVIAVQLVLSLIISGLLFMVCRNDGDLSKGIKSFYSGICEKDMAVSEILDVFKNITKSVFASKIEDDKTASGETNTTQTGEKASFSPVFLTVNFQNPIESDNITSHFGYRISPITDTYSLHTGLDIAALERTDIFSAYSGTVVKAEYNEINGNYVVIKHSDTLKTTYNHCSKLLVREGEKVNKGERIALVGATGYATGSHLHFEVIVNGKYINPLWVLNYEI